MRRLLLMLVVLSLPVAAMAQRRQPAQLLDQKLTLPSQGEVFAAVQANDLPRVKALVQDQFAAVFVNAVDNEQRTPLMFAADNANVQMVKFLVKKGANVLAEDKEYDSVLTHAVGTAKGSDEDKAEIVSFLLDSGAKKQWKDWKQAIKQKQRKVFRALLSEGDVKNNMAQHKYKPVLHELIAMETHDKNLELIKEYFELYAECAPKAGPRNLLFMPGADGRTLLKDYLPRNYGNTKTEAYFRTFIPSYRVDGTEEEPYKDSRQAARNDGDRVGVFR